MGMYDYVGRCGDQVKCFDLPCFSVRNYNKETKRAECNFHVVGGRLASANNAPYMTPYYNYGKNFAILDYRWYEHEEPKVHFFRDGKWIRTSNCNKVSDRYNYPPVTIDYYGNRISISSVKEMKAFVSEFIETDKRHTQMETDGLEALNISYKLRDINYYKSIGQDAMNEEFRLRDQVYHDVYNLTFAIFNKKWFPEDHKSELNLLGMVVYDYLDEQREQRNGYRTSNRVEYEWYALFSGAVNILKDKFENPVEAYLAWCDKEEIQIDKNQVKELFTKYTQVPSDKVITEFEQKIEELPFIYK